jgi:hypothetical protein
MTPSGSPFKVERRLALFLIFHSRFGPRESSALFFIQKLGSEDFHGGIMLATYSHEAKIARTLAQLGCAAQNFCKIAGVGLTRVLQGLNAVPGKHFTDQQAAHLLEVLSELYELQLDVDRLANAHIPINFTRVDAVLTALTIRRVAKIMAEENDHTLDSQALSATKSLTEQK